MIYEVEIEGRTHAVEVERSGDGWTVRIDDGPTQTIAGSRVGRAEWLLRRDGRGRSAGCWVEGEWAALQVGGHGLSARVVDPRRKALDLVDGSGEGVVMTPMPGVIARVLVTEGQPVEKGAVLLVVEAMKMENEYRSPCDGTVQTVHVTAGTAVEANTVLVTVEPGA